MLKRKIKRVATYGLKQRLFVPTSAKEHLKEMVFGYVQPSMTLYYKYLYVIHYLYFYSTQYGDSYEKNGAPINASTLQRVVDKSYSRILSDLEEWGMIYQTKEYLSGSHSRHFKLADKLVKEKFNIITLTAKDSVIVKRLQVGKANKVRNEKFCQHQEDVLNNNVSISDEGLQYLANRYKWDIQELRSRYLTGTLDEIVCYSSVAGQDLMLMTFLLKDFYAIQENKHTRVYTNLTSLKSDHRKYILLDGKPIQSTDLANSQPLFSVALIGETMKEHTKDFYLYKQLAESGSLYEELAKASKLTLLLKYRRRSFKNRFYSEIFFSKNSKWRPRVKKAFIQLFPNVFETITEIKKNNYADFAIKLQQLEAKVFLSVLDALQKAGVAALSIHDSIVVNNETDRLRAEQMIKELMAERYSIKATFKHE